MRLTLTTGKEGLESTFTSAPTAERTKLGSMTRDKFERAPRVEDKSGEDRVERWRTRADERVKHWRQRAEELRLLADSLTDTKAQMLLLDTAKSYDRMADSTERGALRSL
jgi:hypothetical protein